MHNDKHQLATSMQKSSTYMEIHDSVSRNTHSYLCPVCRCRHAPGGRKKREVFRLLGPGLFCTGAVSRSSTLLGHLSIGMLGNGTVKSHVEHPAPRWNPAEPASS